jgi:hypothetical protein
LWHSPQLLQCIKIEFALSTMLLYPSFPHYWNSCSRSIFPFSCMSTYYFPIFTLLYPFPIFSLSQWSQSSDRTCFTFKLIKPFCISLHKRVSVWHFHLYMSYIPNWSIPSVFLLSTIVPSLWLFQQVWKFFMHSCIENISTIFTFLTFFFYPPPSPISNLPLVCPAFHNITSFFWNYSPPLCKQPHSTQNQTPCHLWLLNFFLSQLTCYISCATNPLFEEKCVILKYFLLISCYIKKWKNI